MYYLDVETTGKHGIIVLIQYAIDDGEIVLFSPWTNPVVDTLKLIEEICNHKGGVCGFNIAFDWFHIAKLYNTFRLFLDKFGNEYPEDFIDEIGQLEILSRDGPCLKPHTAFDVMLHARKGPYQSTMDRGDIRIRRVPTQLAWALADELEQRVQLKDIYFARRKDQNKKKWQIFDIQNEDGTTNPDFKDIVLKFAASSALKALAVDALGIEEDAILKFIDIHCEPYSTEPGWAPFAMCVGQPGKWNGAWPEVIHHHISHWGYNELARTYAKNDIVYTRRLRTETFGSPPVGDTDSILACMVAVARLKGYPVDIEGMKELKLEAIKRQQETPTSAEYVKRYLYEVMDETEKLTIRESTKKVILEDIAMNWESDDGTKHPAAVRAKEVLDARKATKEIEIYDKIIQAGRFHASFVVIGTLSSRMAGTDGLNAQGINHSKKVRSRFLLGNSRINDDGVIEVFIDGADPLWPLILCGGDFSGFEVSIAAAVYKDEKLIADLKSGKKFAAIIGLSLFPDKTYEEILESEGEEEDYYDKGKRGGFAFIYGGNENTWESRIGVPIETGRLAIVDLSEKYQGIKKSREKIFNMFCSMRQPGGIGSRVEWHEPADYIESLFGFRRYFTLENQISKVIFELAQNPPQAWREFRFRVVRRDREQTAQGATQSALYGAAFQIQAANLRAAANHEIQSSGATVTKEVEVEVWAYQPAGIHEWVVQPMNVHDEIDAPCHPHIMQMIKESVESKVETFRSIIPLIKMVWKLGLSSWKGKD